MTPQNHAEALSLNSKDILGHVEITAELNA